MTARIFRIYKGINTITGMAYIGVTIKEVHARVKQHWDHANRNNSRKYFLHSAMLKYGRDAFVFEQIAEAYSEREAIVLERAMIATHNTMAPNGYNLSTGGEGGAGWTASPEMRENMAASKRGIKWPPEKRAKMEVIQSSPEYRAKMRANSAKGKENKKPISAESRKKISDSLKHRYKDPDIRAETARKTKASFEKDPTLRGRISKALKGRAMSPGRRAENALMRQTPEFRAKMIEACAVRDQQRREQKEHEAVERRLFDQYDLIAGAP